MHDYLAAFFVEFKQPVHISGTIKDFQPDCGVRNLKAAIEFKYVDDEAGAAIAVSGLFEDVSAYKGSKEWDRFYAVIYQTKAFKSQKHYESDLKSVGAVSWRTILVSGVGEAKAVPHKTTKKSKADRMSVVAS